MPPQNRRALEVHKFGGASLADPPALRHALQIVARTRSAPRVVVVSAMAGVTDALLEVARSAGSTDEVAVRALIDRLRSRHIEVAGALLPAARLRSSLVAQIDEAFTELEALAHGLRVLQELTPRTNDSLISRGERLSARIFAAALETQGIAARYVDALEVVHTDASFGQASPDFARTDRSAQRVLGPLLQRGTIPVVPGFIGATPTGEVATLGRGGSDLTATLLARSLGASRVNLWKDVPGLLTADPRVVPDARVIPQLHAREAAELAYYGAKVLHPRALTPVAGRRISVHVRPFADPDAPGTEVSEQVSPGRVPVKALSAAGDQALITVTGNGMLGVPGIAARTFSALHGRRISVSLISQA
jgi:bifunctional aspartokinase / homoserine dehydrogenase 1